MLFVRRNNVKNRILAIVLIAAFLAQDLVWAYPDIHERNQSATLATQSLLQNSQASVNAEAMLIHRSILANIQKPRAEITLADIKSAADSLINGSDELALKYDLKVIGSKKEVLVKFSSQYAIRYFVCANDKPGSDVPAHMAAIATVPFKGTRSIYKQLLKDSSAIPEAEKLNAEINSKVKKLIRDLNNSSLRHSDILKPSMGNFSRNFRQCGYASGYLMRILSSGIDRISKKWVTCKTLRERAAKLADTIAKRDEFLDNAGIGDYESAKDLTGDALKARMTLLLAGIEASINKAATMRNEESQFSSQIRRLQELAGYVRAAAKWVNDEKAVYPKRDLGYCEKALRALAKNSSGALNSQLIDIANKLSVIQFVITAPVAEAPGPATLRNVPVFKPASLRNAPGFKQLYALTDAVFGRAITNIFITPDIEWIFLLPAILLPEHQTTVIGIMMLVFAWLHLSNVEWEDFARAPPRDKVGILTRQLSVPVLLSLVSIYFSYSGLLLVQVVAANILTHITVNLLVALPLVKDLVAKHVLEMRYDTAAKEAELDRSLKNLDEMLLGVLQKSYRNKEDETEVNSLFNRVADIYIRTADPALAEKRKKLLSLILINIIPPGAKTSQSKLRSDVSKRILMERIFGSKDPEVFQPALEAIIELLARDKKRGKAYFFDRYYPLLKESGKLPRFANALIDVLIKAEHRKIRLFNIDDENIFFDETKLIIKDLSSTIPSLRRSVTSYLFGILRGQGEIPLVRRLLDDINFHIVNEKEFGFFCASKVGGKIRQLQRDRPDRPVVLVLSGGTTMPPFLDELAKIAGIDWARVEIFQHTGYRGKSPEDPHSFANMINEHLVNKVYGQKDRGHFHYIGAHPELRGYMEDLERFGGADILILGLGSNGHIGYNSVGTRYDEKESGLLKLVRLEANTIKESRENNPDIEKNPFAYTMSMADIMKARKIYLFASGARKTEIIKKAFERPLMPKVPVSVLLEHPNISIILDNTAVKGLTKDSLAKYAEEVAKRLDETEERLSSLVSGGLKPSHLIDREGTIVWITQEEAAILDYKPEDMVGRPVWDFVAPEEREGSKKAVMEKLGSPQELAPFERQFRRSDGTLIWCHIQEKQVFSPDGKISGITSNMVDITDEKLQKEQLLSEKRVIETRLGQAAIKPVSVNIASGDDYQTTESDDPANPAIIRSIDEGKAIEIDEKAYSAYVINRDRLNNRAPDIEAHFNKTGIFDRMIAAKDPALLNGILKKSNFANLSTAQREEIIRTAQNINLSMILGEVYVAKTTIRKGNANIPYSISLHPRTGFNYDYHRLEPTIWIGEVLFNRLSVAGIAQLLLEESQHIIKKPERLPDGIRMNVSGIRSRWKNVHGKISETDHPEWVIEHDWAFASSLDSGEASIAELLKTARPPADALILGSIHDTAMSDRTSGTLPDNAQILLSETLFSELDMGNLGRLLGTDSPVKIMRPSDMKALYRARKDIACVITQKDYDNPKIWNKDNHAGNNASLLVLSEDLRESRYLLVEGIVFLARAMVNKDAEAINRYLKILFEKTEDIDDAKLLELLLKDPRGFSDKIKFKTEPFNKEKLYERYKSDVENYLVAA